MIKDKKGVSKNFLAILLVLAILISIIGTYVSLTNVNNVPVQRSSNVAGVGIEIVSPLTAKVGVEVIEGEENG